MDIFIQYAIAASQFAMDDSGLTITPELSRRVGVFIASGIGGFTTIEREHKALLEAAPQDFAVFHPVRHHQPRAGQVSIRFGAQRPNSATCTACSASAHAIGDAFEIIKRGAAEVMIAGGSEAAITPMGIGGFGALRAAVDAQRRAVEGEPAVRPDRDGFIVGEGSGVLILEELESRSARGARSTPSWSATACRPTRTTSPRRPRTATAPFRVMRARSRAPASSRDRSTTSTRTARRRRRRQRRDAGDQALLRRARQKLAVSSTKSMTGHLLGAAGGLEAGITRSRVTPDRAADDQPRQPDASATSTTCRTQPAAAIDYALSNSFGFGGTNAALLFKRFEA
jgi:3-oxoacyl-[acyl-carrier-protein] synthase II